MPLHTASVAANKKSPGSPRSDRGLVEVRPIGRPRCLVVGATAKRRASAGEEGRDASLGREGRFSGAGGTPALLLANVVDSHSTYLPIWVLLPQNPQQIKTRFAYPTQLQTTPRGRTIQVHLVHTHSPLSPPSATTTLLRPLLRYPAARTLAGICTAVRLPPISLVPWIVFAQTKLPLFELNIPKQPDPPTHSSP